MDLSATGVVFGVLRVIQVDIKYFFKILNIRYFSQSGGTNRFLSCFLLPLQMDWKIINVSVFL